MRRQTRALLTLCSGALVLGVMAAPSVNGADRATTLKPKVKVSAEPRPGLQFPVATRRQAVELSKQRFRLEYDRLTAGEPVTAATLFPVPRAVPVNDDCADAIDVGSLPAMVAGDTTEATIDSGAFTGTCGTGITGPGVWYTVTGTGNGITASLCSNTFYDTRLNVFCGDCGSLSCVGGNDDSCGLQSQISWCSEAGTTYYVLVQGYNGDAGPFELNITDDGVPCADPPACGGGGDVENDLCDDAIDLGTLPASVGGTTVGATADSDVSGECGTTITAPGVWYTFLGTGSTVTASLCAGTAYDSKISVFTGTCDAPVCVAGNDDFCSLQSEVSFCAEDGVPYFILVHGYDANTGAFTLDVYDTGVPCVCPDICQIGDTPEGEADCFDEYDDMYNGGCNSATPVFSDIACGETVCGTSGTFLFTDPEFGLSEYRDTDWYKLVLPAAQYVTVTMEASFDGLVGIVDTGGVDDCAGVSAFLVSDIVDRCTTNSVSANLGAGTWYILCSTADFSGVTCGSEYRVTVGCDPPLEEACCFSDGTCMDLLADDCATAGGVSEGLGTTCDGTICPVIPDNDLCEDAIEITSVPGSIFGTTVGSTTDFPAQPDCPGAIISSPGVWYTVAGTGNTMTASFCDGSIPVDVESKLTVYCGPSCDDLFCVNSFTISATGGCSADPQSLSWCSRPGETYYILVHGFAGSTFDFELVISDDATGCDTPPQCEPCMFVCENPDAMPEGEPECYDEYDDMYNGGCNSVTPVFSDIECGDAVCGTSGTFLFTDPEFGLSEYRDTDWYRFTLTDRSLVTIRFQASFVGLVGIVDTGGIDDCAGASSFLASDTGGECEELVLSTVVDPGTWYLFASTAEFTGVACGSQYEISIDCEPVGGCCLPNPAYRAPCIETTESNCVTLHGIYLGNGATCAAFAYSSDPCGNAFEDISGTGIATGIGDEQELLVSIGFSFNFYGSNYTDLYISDNGYLTFIPVTGTSFSNQAIPNPANPNNLIAPLWDDLDPGSGGGVYYQTLGTAPFRRFIVQWDAVPQFFDVDSNTFQAILYEDSNCIEFRYGPVTPESFAGDYTIGVENQDGTAAASVPGTSAADGVCLEFCPMAGADPCPHCVGDVNGDGKTDVFDFSILASHFGQTVTPGTNGDLDGDGFVTMFDFGILAADYTCGTLDS